MGASKKGRRFNRVLWAIAIGLISSFLAAAISQFHLFKTWELKTYDLRMTLTRDKRAAPENVVLFYVDEPSLRYMDKQGISWPWPRELYSNALDFCRRGGARAVIFDLFFSEDSVYGVGDDEEFAKAINEGPPTYMVLFLSESAAPEDPREEQIFLKSTIPFDKLPPWVPVENSFGSLPIQPLIEVSTGFGNAQIPPDFDGVYRRTDLIEKLKNNAIPSIALKITSDIKKLKQISWPEKSRIFMGDIKIPLDDEGRMMVNYYGGTDTFPAYSLAEVLLSDIKIAQGDKPSLNPDIVRDKIVIIGVAAPGLYDMKSSPFSRVYPGPEVHATVIENLLTSDFIKPVRSSSLAVITVLCGLAAAFGLLVISSSWGMGLWLLTMLCLIVGSGFYLLFRGTWMPTVMPFGAFALSAFAMIAFKFLTEGRKKREIRKAFRQYLSPHVVSQIADDPASLKLGGIQKEITIFFSDIANFTSISEKMTPADLVERLNDYFSKTTEIIHENGGTLDKYIGDAIMAFWNAPLEVADHAPRAVRTALEIQKALKAGSKFATRIGIHTNPAVVGNIGSNIRFNYTAIGDAVNLASRLEGLNKNFGTQIIISEPSFNQAADIFEARRIGRVKVKGRSEPIGIFEPLGLKDDFGTLGAELKTKFEEGLELFERGNFKGAVTIFDQIISESGDPVSKSYRERCVDFTSNPPKDFDGVITFTTK